MTAVCNWHTLNHLWRVMTWENKALWNWHARITSIHGFFNDLYIVIRVVQANEISCTVNYISYSIILSVFLCSIAMTKPFLRGLFKLVSLCTWLHTCNCLIFAELNLKRFRERGYLAVYWFAPLKVHRSLTLYSVTYNQWCIKVMSNRIAWEWVNKKSALTFSHNTQFTQTDEMSSITFCIFLQ